MQLMPDQPQIQETGEANSWAAKAVKDLLAGLELNRRLVDAGIWDQRIDEMETDAELNAYGTLLLGLRDTIKLAKRQRKAKR